MASVSLRLYKKTRRVRAYLRWSDHGRTRERYLGEVQNATRADNLAAAWAIARSDPRFADTVREREPASWASSPAVRSVMRANRSRDTKPEVLLRSVLHAHGLRYRVDSPPVPQLRRRADLVFPTARVAVFVDGCYWHGCPEHYRPARINAEFWNSKIEANKARDAETNRLLAESGWQVVRIWEHEPVAEAAQRVEDVVHARRG